jgi:hypothetical protein
MFTLYNDIGMYGAQPIPDPNLLNLGINFHSVEDFIRDRLVPHLQGQFLSSGLCVKD